MQKILIAEDDKFLASAYQFKLTNAGFQVKIADDGEETLNLLKDFLPDILILDLVMPKIDGFSVLAEIKSDPRLKNIPVLVATNLEQPEDVDKGIKMGAADYIVKSNLSLDELVEKIKNILNH